MKTNYKAAKDLSPSIGLEELFNFSTEPMLVINYQYEIMRLNAAACKAFGFTEEELQEENIEKILPGVASLKPEKKLSVAPKTLSLGTSDEILGIKKSGVEFPAEVGLCPFESFAGKFVLVFLTDISVRKQKDYLLKKNTKELNTYLENRIKERTLILEQAMLELEKSREDLREALEREKEVSEMKSRFAAMASHEFRTPLATVLSSLALMSKYGEMGLHEKQPKHVERIRESVNHLTVLLNDILFVSDVQDGKIQLKAEKINIPQSIREAIALISQKAQQSQRINYQHVGREEIILDPKTLKHILHNLLSNAIKFSPADSAIEVRTEIKRDVLTMSVQDRGIGISEKDQKYLFEKFFRGKNSTNIQGTGLGLSIVYNYLKLLGGSINCQSKLNEGTTFVIELPAAKIN